MNELRQRQAPLFEALKAYRDQRVVRFDVPGHKAGRGTPELTAFLGEACLRADVNSCKPLDNLIHPVSVIREAEAIAADAFGANRAFFMVNGTSGAVQAMISASVRNGEKIIMPRNVHRSAINALVVNGAIPVYVNPGVDRELGIPLGMRYADVREAIRRNPDAKALLINNPTYYGVCSDLAALTRLAHANGLRVLVDEAHGTHFYFGRDLPLPAMAAGADMAAVSMHKTGGSLTQSSILLMGPSVDASYVRQIVNLSQTTSASYLLMASLDVARKNLSLNGQKLFAKTLAYADYAREEINSIGDYVAFASERCDRDAFFAFDKTKLSIHTRQIGLAGVEVYDLLRDDYAIQIEFGDIGNVLVILSAGDRALELERLISAFADIKRRYQKDPAGMLSQEYIEPDIVLPPRQAFYAQTEAVALEESRGEISADFVMCYPPGIPILAPGERIRQEVLDYIHFARERGAYLTGTRDLDVRNIQVVKTRDCSRQA